MIKLLLGGSPCTKWSIAQSNRETTCSGEGWELFENYRLAKDLFEPDYFLYENNQSASTLIKETIYKILGSQHYDFNSNLVSPQSRARFYVTNIPNIEIPAKMNSACVKDILDSNALEKFYPFVPPKTEPKPSPRGIVKLGAIGKDSQGNRVMSPNGKGVTLCAASGGLGAKTGLYYIDERGARKLSVLEARRMQTVPDWVEMPVSDAQAYKQLGNGWTVEVIKTFLSKIPNYESEEFVVLSMYDGMGCGYITLKELGCNIKTYISVEIDKYCNQTLDANIPNRIPFLDAFDIRNSDSELYSTILKVKS